MTIDKRYKVTQQDVDFMRKLRADGKSYQRIGNRFGVSWATVMYWCDEKQRNKQRLKNAKRRRHTKEEKLEAQEMNNIRRRILFKENKKWKTQQVIQSAKDDKTRCRKTVMNSYTGKRMKMSDAIKLFESKEYCLSNGKIT